MTLLIELSEQNKKSSHSFALCKKMDVILKFISLLPLGQDGLPFNRRGLIFAFKLNEIVIII